VRISLAVAPRDAEGRIADAGFDASGCGSAIAAGSAAVVLVRGVPLLDAARVGADEIAAELGGLSPAKRHAAELAADALHRALGAAARAANLGAAPGRAAVAMSGGVDSAVAALLVARAGPDPVAVTLELWSDPENDGERSCCSAQAVRGARAVAHGLGLAHLSIDLRKEFRAGVVDPWLTEHAAGSTPNPCVRCNGQVRLDAMLELAGRLGAATLATGHYARRRETPGEPPLLRTAADTAKDQSYMLAALAPESLARLRFPLGDLVKGEVRELARDAGLPVAAKPDSQDLCFLAGRGGPPSWPGTGAGWASGRGRSSTAAGRGWGATADTTASPVGQRRGLGVGGREPLYVLATNARANTVTVGPRAELQTARVALRDATLHRAGPEVDSVRLRYRGRPLACRVEGAAAAGRHARLSSRSPRPPTGPRPASSPA